MLAFDAWTGTPLEGGTAIAGSSLVTAVTGTLGASGVVQLSGPSLVGKVTVTVVAKCHQPMTYVDVPVDTVTVYLTPELNPSCAGDPPSSGNYVPLVYGAISGELVWPSGLEFQVGAWSVPKPVGTQPAASGVRMDVATGDRLQPFQLPDPSAATTPANSGVRFRVHPIRPFSTAPGNQTIYALAGTSKDRTVSPPMFEWTHAMGVAPTPACP